jgi:cytochrome c
MMRELLFAAVAAGVVAFASAAAAQDAEAGRRVFNQCRACHQLGETAKNIVGPRLNGLFGRKAGSIEGFNYTEANKNSGVTWDEPTFTEYIKNPRKFIPGTKMVFNGLQKDSDIANLIAYLKRFDAQGKEATN